MPTLSGFTHEFVPAEGGATTTLVMLHGTGGDERDLLPLGKALHPTAALLSPRGRVLEGALPRFFRRFGEGRFDLDDLRVRAGELAAFLDEAAAHYGVDRQRMVAVGYSNGANIAHATMLLHPDSFAGAALLHAQFALAPEPLPSLAGRAVFLAAGQADPIVPIGEARKLADLLTAAGATVTPFWSSGGHNLTRDDVSRAQAWLNSSGFAS
ncbi:hydrolase [Luteitalea sp. TBR-22]|uniref:alpha/beta hydrolase n=1 Tax=Luteitalea sp. TBR-22 TaxID=2802971 RepID=UPI001AF92D2C|nr:alpha/beta hydrolase [Luteitalea sp. TBR-22]BCS34306.1 hydrolase [Luteitalea sp. TBR-22]